jgi:AcrR family transcriptional regulator
MDAGVSTRTRILHAALDLMGREGPDRFSASALAREAGVSKATLFHHFSALDEIPLAALEEMLLDSMREVENTSASLQESLEGLHGQLDAILHREGFLRTYFVFLVKGMYDERFRERLSAGAMELHERIRSAMAQHLAPGEDPDVTARMLEVMLDGLALHHLLLADHDLLERAWKRFARLLTASEGR